MTFVRSLLRDLVERRLWPVAVLLVAGIVAVPVVLGGGSDASAPVAPPAAAPATAADTVTAQKAEVTLDAAVPADRDRAGAVRNPFKAPASARPKAAPSASTASSAAPSSSAAASTAASTATGGGSTGSTGSTPAAAATSGGGGASSSASPSTDTAPATTPKPTATTKPKAAATPTADDARDTYHVDLELAVKGGTPKTMKDVARLSALPSITDPFFAFLGVIETKAHEKRAVFLVSSDATPNGEGACHPTEDDCESVELAVDQTAYFDLTGPDGAPTQYELHVTALHRTKVRAAATARAAVARHSNAGAELLRDAAVRNVRAAAGARAYRFVPATGLLERARRRHVTAKAAAAGALIPGLALVSGRHQPGIPVWHSPAGK